MSDRRIVIAGTHSGVGKTTITLGLLAALRARGRHVQPFKVGPDFIDPSHHRVAAGRPSRNLDSWLMDDATNLELFARATRGADIAVVEGMMGLFDGFSGRNEQGSAAHMAKLLCAPVVLVVDAAAMARSAGAMVLGYQQFDPQVDVRGVIFNRAGSAGHFDMLKDAVEARTSVKVLGYLLRDASLHMPERHLGLVPQAERDQAELYARIAQRLEQTVDLGALLAIAESEPLPPILPKLFAGERILPRVRIGVALDEAFNFYYEDNLDLLRHHGAQIIPFSPLHDVQIPDVDLLYIGGGFPELFTVQLAGNAGMAESIRTFARAGGPIYAECGGLMYLGETLQPFDGEPARMLGLLPVRTRMTRERLSIGYTEAAVSAPNLIASAGEQLRGHEFHWSEWEAAGSPNATYTLRRGAKTKPDGFSAGSVLGSYLHLHFGSQPWVAQRLVEAARVFRVRPLG
jgi:cobyrinic acid a,c-diamide synthase